MRDAELDEVVEARDRGIKRSRGSERADVHLVEEGRCQGPCLEPGVVPLEPAGIDDARRSVDTLWLPARPRTGASCSAVEAERVIGPVTEELLGLPPSAAGRVQRNASIGKHAL